MNERRKALYDYLIRKGDVWTNQMDVVYALDNYYDTASFYSAKDFHNCTPRHILTDDIRAINASKEFEKVIISGGSGIKIANEEEFSEYLQKQYSNLFKKLKRIRAIEKKASSNNQMTVSGKVIKTFLEEFE